MIISLCLGLVFPIFVVYAIVFQPTIPLWFLLVACALCPLLGAFFGHAALRDARKHGVERGLAKVFAAAGVRAGYLELAFVAFLFLANLPHSHGSPYEASAVGSLRTLNVAVWNYAKLHPQLGFPKNLGDISWKKPLDESGGGIDPTLASGVKLRYRYTYIPRSSKSNGMMDAYRIFADPVDSTDKKLRRFFTDQTAIIRFSTSGPANESSTALN